MDYCNNSQKHYLYPVKASIVCVLTVLKCMAKVHKKHDSSLVLFSHTLLNEPDLSPLVRFVWLFLTLPAPII